MIDDLINILAEIKKNTGAVTVVAGTDEEGFQVIIVKDGFQQFNKMELGTMNTVKSICDGFNQSFAEQQEGSNDE